MCEWVPAKGFEGRYEVSSDGEIRSLLTNRVLSPGIQSRGYSTVGLSTGSVPKRPASVLVHRLVWESFRGPIPPGMQVNHVDGNKRRNGIANLELTTARENVAHANANGLQPKRYRGSNHKNAKLNEQDVERILAANRAGMTHAQLGRAFGVSPKSVELIVSGENWAHVPR